MVSATSQNWMIMRGKIPHTFKDLLIFIEKFLIFAEEKRKNMLKRAGNYVKNKTDRRTPTRYLWVA